MYQAWKRYIKTAAIKFILFAALFNYAIAQAADATRNLTYHVFGLEPAALANVQLRLNDALVPYAINLSPSEARRFFKSSKTEIKKAIQPYGYFRARIAARLYWRQGKWIAIYQIDTGRPLRINQLSIELSGPGSRNANIVKEAKEFPLKEGEIFNVPNYNTAKKDLFKEAKNQGYLRAYFSNKIFIDLFRYTCRILIKLVTGPQYYFGRFIYKTQPYNQEFLQRFIQIKPGEIFSSLRLIQLQQAMEKSYYFDRVVFKPDFKNANANHVPVNVFAYPPKPIKYSLGLGYGTLTGPRISAGLSLRHLNDRGHHLEAELKWSSIIGGVAVNYYIPGNNPLTDEWLIGANIKRFVPKTGKSDSLTLTVGYSTKTEFTQTNINLNFLLERFYVIREPYRYSHLLYPNWKVRYIDADDVVDPHRGVALSLNLQAAVKEVLSTTSFAQALTKAKFIFSPFGKSRFILRGDLGYTTVHKLRSFPLSLRFFAGGINSIRGFADTSIGPGRYLYLASAEYQQALWSQWYAAIFYDAGTAANHFNERINRGVGVGVVYGSRIGPIKVYLARAISKRSKPYSVELSIGPEFT